MTQLFAAPLLAAALLVPGGVPAPVLQEPPVAELTSPRLVDPGTERTDGHTSRGCSFLFLRWC